ncbi:MAG: cytochrome c3 family protein [Deltaproteobacteria bacterium]|nr:cytochrome c3 family protein [Deltaproteobacteria bacterium]
MKGKSLLLLLLPLGVLSGVACSTLPAGKSAGIDPGFCMSCHQEVTPGLFQSWVESKHAAKGVNCVTCHKDHQAAFEQKSMVFPEKCGECHPKQLREYRLSRHSVSWDRMRIQGEYLTIPGEIRSAFCERCHQVQKRCNSCHTSHRFSLPESRDPEACSACHLGPDHPHKEMYDTSLHGTIYRITRNPDRAPRCVTCHMPGGSHDSSFGIARGPAGTGSEVVDLKEVSISRGEQERRREEMVGVCAGCHSRRFAREQLKNADQVKEAGFALLGEGERIIREIAREGLLAPSPEERVPHPTEGTKLVLADPQIYAGTSQLERLFFSMFKFHNIRVWKSGYHFSPSYAHGHGWTEMEMDFLEITEEARKLRALGKRDEP